jgi:hypothetical protein
LQQEEVLAQVPALVNDCHELKNDVKKIRSKTSEHRIFLSEEAATFVFAQIRLPIFNMVSFWPFDLTKLVRAVSLFKRLAWQNLLKFHIYDENCATLAAGAETMQVSLPVSPILIVNRINEHLKDDYTSTRVNQEIENVVH